MSTKPVDAKKLLDELDRIMELKDQQARARSEEEDEMDRRLRQVKWFLAFMIPITLLMLAY